jgi:hypothetical protein
MSKAGIALFCTVCYYIGRCKFFLLFFGEFEKEEEIAG